MTKFTRGKLVSQKTVYEGRIIDLVVDDIEVNGFATVREVVKHPGGVVVLAEVERDRIPFVRQHRYPLNRDLLELPAGKLDSGEDPAVSAARELEEETGFRAHSIRHVCSFYSSPGFCDELLHFYYTDDVSKTEMQTEIDEELELEFYTLAQSLAMIDSGEIQDGKTITAILWLARLRLHERC